ncbi:unnamed protein product [Sphagnum balticum]
MEPIEQDLYKALFHLDSITNAIDCANFMQAVKKDYWKRHKGDKGSKWSPGAKRYQAWKTFAAAELMSNKWLQLIKTYNDTGHPFDVPRGRLEIEIQFRGENHADPDNIVKGLCDAFFKNDKHIDVQTHHTCGNKQGRVIGKVIIE